MNRIVTTVLLAVICMPAFAAKLPKENICHYDLDYGVWNLISISVNSIEKHFTDHDDGLPGERTLGTDTQLDEACVRQALTCPCWTGMTVGELADEVKSWELRQDFDFYSCGRPDLTANVSIGYVGGDSNVFGTMAYIAARYNVQDLSRVGACGVRLVWEASGNETTWEGETEADSIQGRQCSAELLEVIDAANVCP